MYDLIIVLLLSGTNTVFALDLFNTYLLNEEYPTEQEYSANQEFPANQDPTNQEYASYINPVYAENEDSGGETNKDNVWKIEADIPELIRTFFGMPEIMPASRSQDKRQGKNQIFKIEVTPEWATIIQTLKKLIRRNFKGTSHVEEGPGSFKSQRVTYPKNQYQKDLEKLMRLKEKRDKENRRRF